METASSVFINGISGVFAGMAVLYIAMKIVSLVAGPPQAEPAEPVKPSEKN